MKTVEKVLILVVMECEWNINLKTRFMYKKMS